MQSHQGVRTAAKRALAIDVEYIHFRGPYSANTAASQTPPHIRLKPRQLTAAAWVSVVDEDKKVLLYTRLRSPQLPADVHWLGGVPLEELQYAPPQAEVSAQLRELVSGSCVLVGHGLLKDLQALDLADHQDTYDLLTFPQFQNSSGSGYTLRKLAAEHLGLDLHAPKQRHDPLEDALAVMGLYQTVVQPALLDSYEDLVDWHTRAMLQQWQGRQEQS
mmetsp:Transcript_2367/g.3949  ORF Transcript_2367/g.3949 Transcript_2367/m.3949 type:complete len:218 (+) Transcript_2367:78-731(+)